MRRLKTKPNKNLLFDQLTKLQDKKIRLVNFQPLNTSTGFLCCVKKIKNWLIYKIEKCYICSKHTDKGKPVSEIFNMLN